ncbi:MAG: hypothetical protein WA964_19810 [Ilumatobacter sp.]|uniref:hypothetical protein n=1 Tax=Ilumatobacter sp. TaxID=1967498 RepID=UPI003C7085E0
MNDDVLDDPILDERIRRAMIALADSHAPRVGRPPGRESKGRRLLAAAATLLVLCGIGALVLAAGQRDAADGPVSTQAPTPIDSALPTSTDPPATTSSVGGDAVGPFRFDAPLPDSTIGVLEPAPRPFVDAFVVESPDVEFLTGRGRDVQIFVLDPDGSPTATVSATDLDVSRDALPAQQSVLPDGSTLHYTGPGADNFFVLADSSIRELAVSNLRTEDNEFSQFDERLALVTEVAEYVAGQPLDDLDSTDRFNVSPRLRTSPAVVVSYKETESNSSDGGFPEVVIVTTERTLDADEFSLQAMALGEIRDRPSASSAIVELTESPQLQYIEQISPTQFAVILVAPDTERVELDVLIDSLTFTDATAAGIEIESLGPGLGPVIARGDDGWGRWELYGPTSGDDCYGFGATVWSPGTSRTQQSSSAGCPTDDGKPPLVLCIAVPNDQIAGLIFSDAAIETTQPGVDSVLVVDSEQTIDGLGSPRSFIIDVTSQGGPITVTIDGEAVDLPC